MKATKYILIKRASRKGFSYAIEHRPAWNETHIVGGYSKRVYTKEYIACSLDGEFFFSRLDQLRKGSYVKSVTKLKNTIFALEVKIASERNAETLRQLILERDVLQSVLLLRETIVYNITDINEPLLIKAISGLQNAITVNDRKGIEKIYDYVGREHLLDEVNDGLYNKWNHLLYKALEVLNS